MSQKRVTPAFFYRSNFNTLMDRLFYGDFRYARHKIFFFASFLGFYTFSISRTLPWVFKYYETTTRSVYI